MKKFIEPQTSTTTTTSTTKKLLNAKVITKIKVYMQNELFAETKQALIGKKQSTKNPGNPLRSIFDDSFYVEPEGRSFFTTEENVLSTHIANFFKRSNMCRQMGKPLDKIVCVILGDPGCGKTTFGKHFMRKMFKRWEQNPHQYPIPLWVPLSRLKLPYDSDRNSIYKRGLLTYLFKNRLGLSLNVIQLLKTQPLQIFLDSYDEINYMGNLYQDNKWEQWSQAQFVIATRPEKFRSKAASLTQCLTQYFSPNSTNQKGLAVYTISPLKKKLRDQFIEKWLIRNQGSDISDWDKEQYSNTIEAAPNLQLLAENPVMLTMLLHTLPTLAKKYENKNQVERYRLEQLAIYEEFVSIWFTQQSLRIESQLQDYPDLESLLRKTTREIKDFSIKACLHAYTENLAYRCLLDSPDERLGIEIATEQTLLPGLLGNLLGAESLRHALSNKKTDQDEDLLTIWLKLLRSGCLLRCDQDYFAFFHKTLVEYFTQQHLFNNACLAPEIVALERAAYEVAKEHDKADAQSGALNGKLLVKEHNLIALLAKRALLHKTFRGKLYDLVTHSCNNFNYSIAAANAITILKYANQPLNYNKRNWRGLRIPGADLSYAILEGVQWQRGDLRNVNFHGAYLKEADFSQAKLFGCQWPKPDKLQAMNFLAFPIKVSVMVYTSDGELLIVGDIRGKIVFYSTKTYKLVKTLDQSSWYSLSFNYPVDVLAVDGGLQHRKSTLLASATNSINALSPIVGKTITPGKSGIYLWELPSGRYLGWLEGHKSSIDDLQFSEDGTQLVSHGTDGSIFIWDPKQLKLIQQITNMVTLSSINLEIDDWCEEFVEINNTDYVSSSVALSPSGRYIVFVQPNGSLYFYGTSKTTLFPQQKVPEAISIHLKKVHHLRFSPDERYLAACGNEGRVILWSLKTNEAPALLPTSGGYARRVIFSLDGKHIAVILQRKIEWIQLHESLDKLTTQTIFTKNFDFEAALSIDSIEVAVSNDDGVILLAISSDPYTRKKTVEFLSNAKFSRQGHYLVSKLENKIALFSPSTGNLKQATDVEGDFLATSADERNFFFKKKKEVTIYQYDLKNGNRIYLHDGKYLGVKTRYAIAGRYIVKKGDKFDKKLSDAPMSFMDEVLAGHQVGCDVEISFSPNDKFLVSWSTDKTVCIWSTITGKREACFTGHRGATGAISLNIKPDYSGGFFQNFMKASGTTFKIIVSFVDVPLCATFSPNNSLVASASGGFTSYTVFIYSCQGRQQQKLVTFDGPSIVTSLAFSPNGRYLAVIRVTIPFKTELHLWDWQKAHCFQRILVGRGMDAMDFDINCMHWHKNTIRILSSANYQCRTYYKDKKYNFYRLSRVVGTVSPDLTKLSLQGTRGLTAEQHQLLKAQGAQGNPKALTHIVNDEQDAFEEKKELGVLVRCRKGLSIQGTREYTCPALFEPQKHISGDRWHVSLFRITEPLSGKGCSRATTCSTSINALDFHVYGFTEGVDAAGRSVMIQFDLVEDINCPQYARVKHKCVISDSRDLSVRKETFMTMFNPEKILPTKLCIWLTGTVNPQQRDQLLDAIIDDQQRQFKSQDEWAERRIYYKAIGGAERNSNADTFSANCLTWLRRILQPYKLNLPYSIWDNVAVNPRYTLSQGLFFSQASCKVIDISEWNESTTNTVTKSFK